MTDHQLLWAILIVLVVGFMFPSGDDNGTVEYLRHIAEDIHLLETRSRKP